MRARAHLFCFPTRIRLVASSFPQARTIHGAVNELPGMHTSSSASGVGSSSSAACCICFEEGEDGELVRMPCCGRTESSIMYCLHCLRIISSRSLGQVGQCPTCRKYFSVDTAGTVHQAEQRAQCLMCLQTRVIVDERCCGPCLLGRDLPFLYECETCRLYQRIHHPMWKYQATPGDFGTDTWACRACGDYRHWRIAREHAAAIPPEHCPESWGRREDWLAAVRETRLREIGLRRRRQVPEPGLDLTTWFRMALNTARSYFR